eukprot:7993563-Pyramimonas_sp.AAC.1
MSRGPYVGSAGHAARYDRLAGRHQSMLGFTPAERYACFHSTEHRLVLVLRVFRIWTCPSHVCRSRAATVSERPPLTTYTLLSLYSGPPLNLQSRS